MEIRVITYEESEALIRGDKSIVHNREGTQFGLFEDGCLVSVLTVTEENGKKKIKGLFTPVSNRRRGYGYSLLKGVCDLLDGKITARAVQSSVGMFLKVGFTLKKESQCGQFRIFAVEMSK